MKKSKMNPLRIIRKISQPFALVTAFVFIVEIFTPLASFAITGYDSMPEYNSFEPVATTNMVNNFDGSFTYNLPIMNVPNGYPINLSYHSGDVSTESMASWVGFGWNINPGTINRNKRGFADDWNGQEVTYYNKTEANWTISADATLSPELFSKNDFLNSIVNASTSTGVAFNNYRGFSSYVSARFSAAGVVNMDLTYAGGKFGFNASVNPSAIFSAVVSQAISASKKNKSTGETESTDAEYLKEIAKLEKSGKLTSKQASVARIATIKNKSTTSDGVAFKTERAPRQGGASFSLANMFTRTGFPSTMPEYIGFMTSLQFDAGGELFPLPIAGNATLSGKFARQDNKEERIRNVYGYLHNEKALDDPNNMMDYFKENDQPYENRGKVVGYPLPNNDTYSQSGEAMGGSFRPYRSEFGHYRPDRMFSQDIGVNFGVDVNIPVGITSIPGLINVAPAVGGSLSGDYHATITGDWDENKIGTAAKTFNFKEESAFSNSRENFFFRYGGDKGGNYDLAGNDQAFRSDVDGSEIDLGGWSSASFNPSPDQRENKRRSTYVDYHTNQEVNDVTIGNNGENFRYKAYDKKTRFLNGTAVEELTYSGEDDNIAEYTTLNPDGVRYVYGLPVQVKNETQLSYNLTKDDYSARELNETGGGLIAFPNANTNIDGNDRKIGYSSSGEYASAYLLTEISDPDYVDRTMNGPTPDDFGNYTKFNYERIAGGSDWFAYRSPYTGVNFNSGSLSTSRDDMGSFSAGDKEVYYLNSVVSKTHVAIFTLEDRDDGVEAYVGPTGNANDLIRGEDNSTRKQLKRLKQIDLYAIKDVEEIGPAGSGFYQPLTEALPIKTAHFDYTYELSSELPNNMNNEGKLTLKRVWFEYEGKRTYKISPYIFHYQYPQPVDGIVYPAPYSNFQTEYALLASTDQNPNYDVRSTDRWSKYRDYKDLRDNLGFDTDRDLARFWPYINQNPSTSFDPAAWALKRIELPSGGEIHIQYEQHDYQFVQDKRAMTMVPLATIEDGNLNRNFLDLEKIGISQNDFDNMSAPQKEAFVRDLFEPMRLGKQRMFFNYLYTLIGNSTADYRTNNAEYIEGYARIQGFGYNALGKIYFVFKANKNDLEEDVTNNGGFYEQVEYPNDVSSREVPQKVCKDFFNGQRKGLVTGGANALSGEEEGENLLKSFITALVSLQTPINCAQVNAGMSYVRVQMPLVNPTVKKSKLAGGFRVKRILMYDDGVIDTDPNSLYGQEYDYSTTLKRGEETFIISSGVATNEPGTGRRENVLVQPIDKEAPKKTFGNFLEEPSILFGRDMYSNEGPIGEALLPAPSIGYEKVTISNIYKGKTSTGREECEFYTCKDWPFEAKFTDVDQADQLNIGGGADVGGFGFSYNRKGPYVSQGYSFVNYSMHGQPKRKRKYAHLATAPMAEEIYEYFEPGDQMLMVDENKTLNTVPFSFFGKEAEILAERNEVYDIAVQASASVDLMAGSVIYTIPPFVAIAPLGVPTSKGLSGSVTENLLHKHVTSKIITYPAILKSVTNIADDVENITDNVAFDKFTGEPCVVQTRDDFKGNYLNYDFSASWDHPNMRSIATNARLTSQAVYGSDVSGEFLEFDSLQCAETAKFVRGDLLAITIPGGVALYHVDKVEPLKLTILPSGMSTTSPSIGNTVNFEIIRSGYTNQLSAKQGNIMTYSQDAKLTVFDVLNNTTTQGVNWLNNLLAQTLNSPTGYTYAENVPATFLTDGTPVEKLDMIVQKTTTPSLATINIQIRAQLQGQLYQSIILVNYDSENCLIEETCINEPGLLTEMVGLAPLNSTINSEFSCGFTADDNTGQLTFNYYGACGEEILCSGDVSCFEVAPNKLLLDRVITASATSYFDYWPYTAEHYPNNLADAFMGNPYEQGIKGNWRPKHQYVYRENINTVGEKYNKEEGTFQLELFDWEHVLEEEELLASTGSYNGIRYNPKKEDGSVNINFEEASLWLLTTSMTKYNPNGDVIEDKNILDVFSTSKYVDNQTIPGLVAQNAKDHTVAFESFENGYDANGKPTAIENETTLLEDGLAYNNGNGAISTLYSHTGKRSVQLSPTANFQIANIAIDDRPEYSGGSIQVQAWFRSPKETDLTGQLKVVYGTNNTELIMTKQAGAGEWELYEAFIDPSQLLAGTSQNSIRIQSAIADVYMDDARVQPLQAEMVCYVYDDAQRIVAVLDDWHFAMIYEYNPEGILVRKIKETVNGLKTVSETQYNAKGRKRSTFID